MYFEPPFPSAQGHNGSQGATTTLGAVLIWSRMRIKNWDKFQHFKDRRPPWIKLYRDLLDDAEWAELSPPNAKFLVMLWLLASEDKGTLPDYKNIAFRLRMSEKLVKSIVSELSHWVVHDDINLISTRYQLGPSETETETETENNGHVVRNYREESKIVLEFLNEKTSRNFRAVEANLAFIEARLRSGVEVQDCKTLIARKVRDWGTNPTMMPYLRPETLFNKTKFETYLAEVSQ
jgi:uncharacterized phage protein (TIGR02220 family)